MHLVLEFGLIVGPICIQPSSRDVRGVARLPTIESLIFNFSSFPTQRVCREKRPDCCCNSRSHIPTDNDPTQLLNLVGV